MGFYFEKKHLLRAYYLGFDWSGWIVFTKSEILITTGTVWPVSSDKMESAFRAYLRGGGGSQVGEVTCLSI